jgi:hypothetical protein
MSTVTIVSGTYRNFTLSNQTMRLVAGFKSGAKGNYVTVIGDDTMGEFEGKQIRVKVEDESCIVADGTVIVKEVAAEVPQETDDEAIERIRERFQILEDMTEGARDGNVKALIVSGPPGIGKSYGVERVLEQASFFDIIGQRKVRYEVVKGAMSALGLYAKLYQFSDPNCVLVFDDCDSILQEDLSLNILKAALDSSSKRTISWNTDSHMLDREGIPNRFDFKGSVIFISNIKFENVRSAKLRDHLDALESRCHYLDLTMDTTRDKMLRIKQIVKDGMLDKYEFSEDQTQDVMNFVIDNASRLREISLRTVLKVADLVKMKPMGWKRYAETTIMKRA